MARNERRVVVITGASAGVGRATAVAFARQGAAVALLARGDAGLRGAEQDVLRAGGTPYVIALDVSDADAVASAAREVERELGPIDVWVNNAMVSVFSPVRDMTPDEYRRVTEVNYLGYVYGTLAALEHMRTRDRGVIVQVGSALAYRSIPLQSAYCASKAAIRGFTDSLRSELLHDGSRIKVTMVQMPALNTPQFGWVRSRLAHKAQPVPPIFQPEVAAGAIVWASSHPRRELRLGLSTLAAIVGNKIAPGLIDRYLARTGYDAQQTDEPRDHDQPDNLYQPVDNGRGDYGAHGSFDSRARARSWELFVTENRLAIAGLTLAAAATAVAGRTASRR